MQPKRSDRVALFALSGLILICLILLLSTVPDFHISRSASQLPDWYMKKVTAYKTDQQGKLKAILRSPNIDHFNKDNHMQIATPRVVSFDSNHTPWHISANHANAFQNKPEHIHLIGEVNIHQLPGKNSKELHIATSEMTYFPDTSTAITKQPAVIQEPGLEIHTLGLTANLKTGIMQFKHDTKAVYQSEQ